MKVNKDHQVTMRVSTAPAPLRSAQRAVGISKIAYARMKAVKTHPIWASSRLKSAAMCCFIAPMQERSRYVTMASATMKAMTTYRARVGRCCSFKWFPPRGYLYHGLQHPVERVVEGVGPVEMNPVPRARDHLVFHAGNSLVKTERRVVARRDDGELRAREPAQRNCRVDRESLARQ